MLHWALLHTNRAFSRLSYKSKPLRIPSYIVLFKSIFSLQMINTTAVHLHHVTCTDFCLNQPIRTRVRPQGGGGRGIGSAGKERQPIPIGERVPLRVVARCGLFTLISVNTLFFGSIIWGFERWRSKASRIKQGEKLNPKKDDILSQIRKKLERYIQRPLRAHDIYWVIVAANVLVFLAHRSPLGPITMRYFVNSPYGRTPALSMLLSVFSHHSLLHLGINMYVLHSFTSSLISMIGPEDFVTLFVGGGIFASFFSLLSKSAHRSLIPSLGASGGICAVLGAFCLLQPHAKLCVPFVVDIFPHSFDAKTAVWAMLVMEFGAALFLSARSPIDHAAHLGGLLFGMYYSVSGGEAVWQRRNTVVTWWRQLTGS